VWIPTQNRPYMALKLGKTTKCGVGVDINRHNKYYPTPECEAVAQLDRRFF
jgi:hypothetical protein